MEHLNLPKIISWWKFFNFLLTFFSVPPKKKTGLAQITSKYREKIKLEAKKKDLKLCLTLLFIFINEYIICSKYINKIMSWNINLINWLLLSIHFDKIRKKF